MDLETAELVKVAANAFLATKISFINAMAEVCEVAGADVTPLAEALWHDDVDCAFCSWNGPWLDPEFTKWDITEALGYIRVPILVVQGEDDQYGTIRQVEAVKEECYCPVETVILPGVRHSPHRDAPERTLEATSSFINRLLRDHHESDRPPTRGLRPDAL